MTQSNTLTTVKWRCPSNIAIIKYWGKKEGQIPCNSSLSMTLANACTETEISLTSQSSGKFQLHYYFEGKLNTAFGDRVRQYVQQNEALFPYICGHSLRIESTNSFPHSAGIASSASSFGAIALGMLELEYQNRNQELDAAFYRDASSMARLGSGSACRSIYPMFSFWGRSDSIPDSSDQYAVPVPEIHPEFSAMYDAILIVDDRPKKVSSSAGHALMNDHAYASQRFLQANQRSENLIRILQSGDLNAFVSLTESDALTLHAMMMTSSDYYLLMKPNTLVLLEQIVSFRNTHNIPMCFTLDAGPNVHLLYPESSKSTVEDFVRNELNDFCKTICYDQIGHGPQKLN